jgi:hypothetical protein
MRFDIKSELAQLREMRVINAAAAADELREAIVEDREATEEIRSLQFDAVINQHVRTNIAAFDGLGKAFSSFAHQSYCPLLDTEESVLTGIVAAPQFLDDCRRWGSLWSLCILCG